MTLGGFVLSVLASLTAIARLYVLYIVSAGHARQRLAKAECWWLPGADAFRFVIRNIHGDGNLSGIRYRAWLRKEIHRSDDIRVDTSFEHGSIPSRPRSPRRATLVLWIAASGRRRARGSSSLTSCIGRG